MSEISKIVVILRPERFSVFKEALKNHGILGMTVIHAEGCGLQGGKVEYYRGAEIEIDLLPKIKVELVVPTEKVDEIISICKSTLKTGKMGDGKIFVYDVGRVIRISNESEGLSALDISENQ